MSSPLYKSKQWYALRRTVLKKEPLCRMCKAMGRVTQAYAVDHIVPHKGNMALFHDLNNLQPLCRTCHNKAKQGIEHRGYDNAVDSDGYPIDPSHPSNRRK